MTTDAYDTDDADDFIIVYWNENRENRQQEIDDVDRIYIDYEFMGG